MKKDENGRTQKRNEDSNDSLFHLFDGFAEPAGVFAEESSIGRLRIVGGDVSGSEEEFREEWQFHVDARLGIRRLGRL